MTDIYAFPPVGLVGYEFTVEHGISLSRSLATGRSYVSAVMPERRVATLVVSAMAIHGAGAGYMEMLKRYLRGGLHLVRVRSRPMVGAHVLSGLDGLRGQVRMFWTDGYKDLTWTEGFKGLEWYEGTPRQGQSRERNGFPGLRVAGLPPNRIVAYPSELVRAGDQTARVVTIARTDGDGVAFLRLDRALPSGDVVIGASETVVYRMAEIPRATVPLGQDWTYQLSLEEVFADEIDSPREVDPW